MTPTLRVLMRIKCDSVHKSTSLLFGILDTQTLGATAMRHTTPLLERP